MTTTAKAIVPQAKPTTKKPLSKAHKAKLVTGLEKWRASLTDVERAELAERNRQTHRVRWNNMSERERKERLAGVRVGQKEQQAKKRAAAKAKTPSKVDPKKAPPEAVRSVPRSAESGLAARQRGPTDELPAGGSSDLQNVLQGVTT